MEMEMENKVSGISQTDLVSEGKPGISFSISSATLGRIMIIVTLAALILFIVGIALIAAAVSRSSSEKTAEKISVTKVATTAAATTDAATTDAATTDAATTDAAITAAATTAATTAATERCKYSEEAKKVGLDNFLKKVRDTYYKLHPENSANRPKSTSDTIRKEYRAYDPTPSAIKNRTDTAYQLLKEINETKIDVDILKPREYKALLQVKHYLKYIFGTPYDGNYYAGDWMLGPNTLCWLPICNLGNDINNNIGKLKPRKASEVGEVIKHFQAINATVLQYISNMKLGVKTGMVRTTKECDEGLTALKKKYENVAEQGKKGALNEWYTKPFRNIATFLEKMPTNEQEQWKQQTGKPVKESLTNAITEHIGGSLEKLLKYLEGEHRLHCRPNDVGGSGLSGLPIDVIYYNGSVSKSMKTTKRLPIADAEGRYPVLNGNKSYEFILGYFTTKDLGPNDVAQLGWKMVNRMYPQVEAIVRQVTEIDNITEAITAFKLRLQNLTLSYFNAEEIPENQTNQDAIKYCKNEESAKQYCPDRWAAVVKWLEFARIVMAMYNPKTVSMFYFTGEKRTTPSCPLTIKAHFNPARPYQKYTPSDSDCTKSAVYSIPFFTKNVGPKYEEYSVNAHEAYPGHHTQMQGYLENFKDKCGGLPRWLDDQTKYTAFKEGWGLYAESVLIAQGTDTYKDQLMQKYGFLKWQVWRALRLIVDTGLHYRGMTRKEALDLFDKYTWDKTVAEFEVTRYQSNPGQSTSYMIGQLDITKLRNKTEKALDDKFSLREFHYQILSQGSSPLSYLESHIDKYIICKKNPKKEGCDLILNPTKASGTSSV